MWESDREWYLISDLCFPVCSRNRNSGALRIGVDAHTPRMGHVSPCTWSVV